MESTPLVDCAGRRRSPATLPGHYRGRPPRNTYLRGIDNTEIVHAMHERPAPVIPATGALTKS